MKVELARQIRRFKEQKALDNWLAHKQYIRTLESQAYQNRIHNMERLFHHNE